jgi:Calcineurin-like phosphoesterase
MEEADRPPQRPRDLSPESLEFDPQGPVHWYSPKVLVGAGLRAVLTAAFGSFLDKRELQSRLVGEADSEQAHRPELWLDYVADTGDGFDATYSVASLLAPRSLSVATPGAGGPLDLPRGQVLVLGGDQIYPVATTRDYANRFEGPFRAALPWTVDDHPTLFALPGNHDWYDGLTGFLRQFAQQRWIGGWRTRQSRSYFALQLPHRWWLWGMDIQSDRYIDEPQLSFFERVLDRAARPGDRLILATASPTWVRAERDPETYRNLAFVERKLLEPRGVGLELVLAGDRHHYARYTLRRPAAPEDPGPPAAPPTATHRITAGGGGAFLSPTHDIPARLRLPVDPRATTTRRRRRGARPDPQHHYDLATCYPDRARSRVLAFAALLMPLRNPGILWVTGLAHVVLFWTDQFGIRSLDRVGKLERGRAASHGFMAAAERSGWEDLTVGLVRNSLGALLLIILACGLYGLAESPAWATSQRQQRLSRLGIGLLHTAAHMAAVVAVSLLAIKLASDWDGVGFAVGVSLIDAVVGAIAGATVLGGYFALTNALPGLGIHGNEGFSASRLTSYRHFLRLHIDRQGALTVYAVGIDRVARRWRPDPDPDPPDPEQAWLAPQTRLAPHLIDQVTID